MTRLLRSLWVVALGVIAFGCSKDDPLPRSTVEFTNGLIEVGIPVMFDNLTLNADRYEWKFSDGQTSEEISPNITFNSPGAVDVVLKAFTKDGQIDSVARTVNVLQRYLTGYIVKAFPTDSIGFDWDINGATAEDKLPDILVEIVVDKANPTQAEIDNSIIGPVFLNASGQDVGDTITQDVVLTNESWVFILRDWDGADENNISLADPFSFVTGVTFNPVQVPTTKTSDAEGFFSITGFDSNDKFIDINVFFELR